MVKIPTRPSKLIHRLNAIQIKIAARFFFIYSPGQVYSKIYIKIKRTIMAETISEKKKVGGLSPPNFEISYTAIETGGGKDLYRSMAKKLDQLAHSGYNAGCLLV